MFHTCNLTRNMQHMKQCHLSREHLMASLGTNGQRDSGIMKDDAGEKKWVHRIVVWMSRPTRIVVGRDSQKTWFLTPNRLRFRRGNSKPGKGSSCCAANTCLSKIVRIHLRPSCAPSPVGSSFGWWLPCQTSSWTNEDCGEWNRSNTWSESLCGCLLACLCPMATYRKGKRSVEEGHAEVTGHDQARTTLGTGNGNAVDSESMRTSWQCSCSRGHFRWNS